MSGSPAMRNVMAGLWVLALLSCFTLLSGCGPENLTRTTYVVKQGGTAVGDQTVWVEKLDGAVKYYSTERRPYLEYQTTTYRSLESTSDMKTLKKYVSKTRVPGASYSTTIGKITQPDAPPHYYYLDDRLQTFEYLPRIPVGRGFLPLEMDSSCLLQAAADKFLAARLQEARAMAVVPSRSPLPREVFFQKTGADSFRMSGEGLGEVTVTCDRRGLIESVTGIKGGLEISKGSVRLPPSRPFETGPAGYTVRRVTVKTPDRVSAEEFMSLSGRLYLPRGKKKPYRGVVLAGDWGPQDYTGGGFLSQFASHLAAEGMAVLCCDRRGVPDSGGSYARYTLESYASDIDSQVQYMALRDDIDGDRIALLGYGEGGIAAVAVASSNPYISDCVLMATPAVRIFPELEGQVVEREAARGVLLEQEAANRLRNIKALTEVLDMTSENVVQLEGKQLFLGWMRSQAGNDLAEKLARLDDDVLVVQGTGDEVVPPDQARSIMAVLEARGRGRQRLALFEGLGHSFGRFNDEAESRPFRAHPVVDPEVLRTVSGWLKKH